MALSHLELAKKQRGLSATTENLVLQVITRIGTSGAVIIFLIVIMFAVADKKQQSEFIDKYILLRDIYGAHSFIYVIIIFLVMLYISTWFYFYNRLKLKTERIEELTEERTYLQSLLLSSKDKNGNKLSTSKP